ncbi:MAG: hypothetical protein HOK63_06025 [Thaumarchaeota archaeon]|nr:hypothetical protein [Nitrososphaerota archaeon]MBT5843251.1 hypothetical protein [Nitrososphaerota archaeon]MBT6469187.1 hypothetical protein [Nitrososphaerota archaeon]
MSKNPEELKKIVKEYNEKLAKLGTELAKSQFSYKVEEKTDEKYWIQRIANFKKHNEKSLEYYNEVYSMIKEVKEDEAEIFLLGIAKFRQTGVELLNTMTKIIENPSIIKSKDTQQSQWSKDIRKKLTEQSDECLRFEKEINTSFREFYDKFVKVMN